MKNKEIHFEDIWSEAESLVTTEDLASHSKQINNLLTNVQNNPHQTLGILLLHISALAKIYNVNVAVAMAEQVEELKIDKLE